ncbi:MAG: MBL fold metallo-hydrolase [Parachlamydiales bacterium]|nr:MBL fold metallo-hydrolase [Parachlamydiales bacterium]
MAWLLGLYNNNDALEAPPNNFKYPNQFVSINEDHSWVQWINHSTFLLNFDNYRLLTDPIFSLRCSPFKNLGPKRKVDPALDISSVLPVDVVLISHNHYDHLDKYVVKYFVKHSPSTHWLVPKGVKKLMVKLGVQNVTECNWWETVKLSNCDLIFHFVPAQHFSGRGFFDTDRSLWGGWVVENKEKRFYFAGDTGYNSVDFLDIGNRFESMDLSIIPIGAYSPKKLMACVHCSPEEAVFIHQDVNSKLSIASHWKTFNLAEEKMDQPPYDLYKYLEKSNIDFTSFRVLNIGQKVNW